MRALVTAAFVAVTVSLMLAWFGFLAPSRAQRQTLQEQTAALQQDAATLTNRREELRALQQRAPLIQADLDRLEDFVPVNPDQAMLLDSLQAAGTQSGVVFTALTFGDPSPITGAPRPANPDLAVGSITVVGEMEAGYFELVDFLRRLEVELPRAILVESVRVDEGEAGFPQVRAEFTAQIFALIDDPGLPLDPLPTPDPEVTLRPETPAPVAPSSEPAIIPSASTDPS